MVVVMGLAHPCCSAANHYSSYCEVLLVLALVCGPSDLLWCAHKQTLIVLAGMFTMPVTCLSAVQVVSRPASEVPSLWPSSAHM